MREGEVYSVADALGQPREVSDDEFFLFAIGDDHLLKVERRREVGRILKSEPWCTALLRDKKLFESPEFLALEAAARATAQARFREAVAAHEIQT